jgi:hypothetical protein
MARPISDDVLMSRWSKAENLLDEWDDRTRLIGALIPPGASVIEFGAGRMVLRDFLPRDCCYRAADLVARDERTLVCDLNGDLPVLGRKHTHAVFSGVLEYVRDVDRVARFLAREVQGVVASYTPLDNLRSLRIRHNNGWVSHLTADEFVSAFDRCGFSVTQVAPWRDQLVYVFSRPN